jgi:hypothetical protein
MKLTISAKCSDCFCAILTDQHDNVIAEYDGYVPSFMPGKHFGDYVILEIDNETGRIRNWTPATKENLHD